MKASKFLIIIYAVFIYMVFSATSIIPANLSFPFIPYRFQAFSSLYYYKNPDTDELIKKAEKQIGNERVKKQALENLGIFENANLINGIHADTDTKTYRYSFDGKTYQTGRNKKLKTVDKKYSDSAVYVKAGSEHFAFSGDSLYDGAKGYSFEINRFAYFDFGDKYTYESVSGLLEKQLNHSLTKNDFSLLVQLRLEKKLAYWNNQEHIAVFHHNGKLVRYDTQSNKSEVFSFDIGHNNHLVVSSEEIVYHDTSSHSIILYNFVKDKKESLVSDVPEVKALNYQSLDDYLQISFYSDGAIWSYVKNGENSDFKGTAVEGELVKFALCEDEILVLYTTDNGEKLHEGYISVNKGGN